MTYSYQVGTNSGIRLEISHFYHVVLLYDRGNLEIPNNNVSCRWCDLGAAHTERGSCDLNWNSHHPDNGTPLTHLFRPEGANVVCINKPYKQENISVMERWILQ